MHAREISGESLTRQCGTTTSPRKWRKHWRRCWRRWRWNNSEERPNDRRRIISLDLFFFFQRPSISFPTRSKTLSRRRAFPHARSTEPFGPKWQRRKEMQTKRILFSMCPEPLNKPKINFSGPMTNKRNPWEINCSWKYGWSDDFVVDVIAHQLLLRFPSPWMSSLHLFCSHVVLTSKYDQFWTNSEIEREWIVETINTLTK